MSGPPVKPGGRKVGRIFELLGGLCVGEAAALPALLELLPCAPNELTQTLLAVAVRHAGTRRSQATCRAHLRRRDWAKWLPLDAMEYQGVLGEDPRFDLGIEAALTLSGWAEWHRRQLEVSTRRHLLRTAARALKHDLDALAAEAAAVLVRLPTLRAQIKPPLHAVQAQALLRAEGALGSLRGVKALDIGCSTGALVAELRARGALAVGVDLAPSAGASGLDIVRADFADGVAPAKYGLVVATGVFEAGSCKTDEPQGRSLSGEQLLSRLREVTARGGVVVLENFGLPIPFTLPQAGVAGFALVPQIIPSVNLALGGRGCTLRRVR